MVKKKMMKKNGFILVLLLFCSSAILFAQDTNPTHWNFSFAKKGKIVTVTATATIDEGWKIYGTKALEDGPNATLLGLSSTKGFALLDSTVEVIPTHKVYDKMFEMDITYYKTKAVVKRRYKIVGGNKELEGYVEFQCCNDTQCIRPTQVPFKFKI